MIRSTSSLNDLFWVCTPSTEDPFSSHRVKPMTSRGVQARGSLVQATGGRYTTAEFDRDYTIIPDLFRRTGRILRRNNAGFDLVGVETNPGPTHMKNNKPSTAKAVKGKATKSKSKPRKQGSTQVSNSFQKSAYPGGSKAAVSYLKSVLAPCIGNARIPDMNCIPTVLYTVTQELSIASSAGGVGGITLSCSPSASYATESAASTDAAFAYNASVALTGVTSAATIYSYTRVVSACIDLTFMGSVQFNAGMSTGWSLASFAGAGETGPASLAAAQTTRINRSGRVADGLSIFYRPSDSTCFDFRNISATNPYGTLGLHFSGMSAATLTHVKLTINFEGVPNVDSFSPGLSGMNAQPSPVDPTGHAVAVAAAASRFPIMSKVESSSLNSQLSSVGDTFSQVLEIGKTIFKAAEFVGGFLL